jgi:ArsR family transcriptional regulator
MEATVDVVCRADVLRKARPRRPSRSAEQVARVLKAIADPTRLTMLALLAAEADALCVCHIEARFRLSQPTISHHLRVLREAGLVTSERRGAWVHYALDRTRVEAQPGLSSVIASVDASGKPRGCCP